MTFPRKLTTLGVALLLITGLLLQRPLRGSAAALAATPVGQTATDWTLTFNDEFNSTALNRTVWRSDYGNGGNGELQEYVDDDSHTNYIEQNGALSLVARKESYNGKAYTSGVITTQDHFFQKYGYFEIRARVPYGKGLWPAFWLMPNPNDRDPEIDTMEIIDSDVKTVFMTLHYYNTSGGVSETQNYYTGTDFSSGWHTYAVDWQPTSLTWYVDGIARKQVTDQSIIPAVPMFVIADMAVGGTWPGSPDSTTVFPSNFDIDYIRVWQKAGMVTPTPIPTNNMVKNASFEDPGAYPWDYPWNYRNDLGAVFTQDTTTAANSTKASLKATLSSSNSAQPWVVSAMQYDKSITAGQSYSLTFWAKASAARPIHAYVQEQASPYTVYFTQAANLTTAWTKFSYTFTQSTTTSTAILNINLAEATGSVWLDEVSLCKTGVDCNAPIATAIPSPTSTARPSPTPTNPSAPVQPTATMTTPPTAVPPSPTPTKAATATAVPPSPTATKAAPTATTKPLTDTIAPVVSISFPANGASVTRNAAVTISANASDASGIAKVEFRLNGTLICVDTRATFDCPWTVPNTTGVTYTIEARAYDNSQNTANSTIKVTTVK